ncbi:MAG: outer membrane lipoprotein-sorting protein, partial [Candidatus Aminicenantes bacterium]|nr:outer membrane lipoprotein-sorting protein [Candidatus Aminicenantes bacterium]
MKRSVPSLGLFLCLAVAGGALGERPAPEIAVALSLEGLEAEAAKLSSLDDPGVRLVLPPMEFKPGKDPDTSGWRRALALTGHAAAGRERFWMRLRVEPPPRDMAAADVEAAIRSLTGSLVTGEGFPCAGIVLDIDADTPAEYAGLLISALSVALKAAPGGGLVAVPAEVAAALGSRVAVHADRYTLRGPEGWRPAMQRLAMLNLLRPTLLFWTGEEGRSGREAYLDGLLAAFKYGPEIFVLDSGRLEGLEDLLITARKIKAHLPEGLTALTDDAPLFWLSSQKGHRPAQAVFVDDLLDRVVLLAKTGDTRMHPGQWRFAIETGDSYAVEVYDPLAPGPHRGEERWPGNIVWNAEYLLIQAGRVRSESLRFGETIDVSATVDLTVAEIIARWQQYHSRQRQLLRHYTAAAEMDMHFQPPGLGSGFDVSLHFRYFWNSDGSRFWEQTAQFLNGIEIKGRQTFPLPQIEPDKVVVQPLEMKLVENYVYVLDGTETVDGLACYAISFRPRPEASESLFSGRIWIDKTMFRRVRMLLVQANNTGSITSNREMQFFALVKSPDGEDINVLVRSDVDQKVLVAGREFLLERRYRFRDLSLNGPDYRAAFEEAFRGNQPMFAETEAGLREFVKDKEQGRRVVEDVDTFVWSLILGAIYDGTFRFPLPIVGASAIDSDFLGTGGQLSGFWAGPILAVNTTWKSRDNYWTYGADVFLSALPRHDRVYRDGVEAGGEGLYSFSESLGARLRWQPAVSLSFTLSAYLTYEIYAAAKSADDDFVLPRNGFTLNPNISLEYSHGGYLASFELAHGQRLGWKPWGPAGDPESPRKSYQRAFAKLGKQFYLNSFTRLGVEM